MPVGRLRRYHHKWRAEVSDFVTLSVSQLYYATDYQKPNHLIPMVGAHRLELWTR